MNYGPPHSGQMPQANAEPNPSSNNTGHAPSLERHANRSHVPKYNSNLGHQGYHEIGSKPNLKNPFAHGFHAPKPRHMEQARHGTGPIVGAGTGAANPHADRRRTLTKAERSQELEARKLAPTHRPPHFMHPDTVAKAAGKMPKLGTPAHFGTFAAKAAAQRPATPFKSLHRDNSTHVAPTVRQGKFHPAGTQFDGAKRVAPNGAGQTMIGPTAVQTAPKLIPETSKARLALPSFKKGIGGMKAQPAKALGTTFKAQPATPKLTAAKPAPKPVTGPSTLVRSGKGHF